MMQALLGRHLNGRLGVVAFCNRHYPVLAAAVLVLAAVNFTCRLGKEGVEWDESLYAISAWEMVTSADWIGTTFYGTLDYYNSKPPLNIWLIALAFKAFGMNLVSLRLVSACSAFLTVAVLQWWARRLAGPAVALFASAVLATSLAFVHVHSGRTAETDALFTLLVLLTVVTLWAGQNRPWNLVWLGPLAAAAFLLRGMAVLMPLAIVLVVEAWRGRPSRQRWLPLGTAGLLLVAPVAAWMVARWRLDEWRFFDRLLNYDFVARSFTVLEGHPGGPLYYFNVLHKYQYDWLVAGVLACVLFPLPWSRVRNVLSPSPSDDGSGVLLGAWVAVTLFIPTLMRTKLYWYLNPFYPAFALGIAWVLVQGFSQAAPASRPRRGMILGLVVVVAFGIAESRLVWHSFKHRNLTHSVQGLLLAERDQLKAHAVFREHWDHPEVFVLRALVGAQPRIAADPADFLRNSQHEDYLVLPNRSPDPGLALVGSSRRHSLYRRRE